jgi:hypothetical protein
MRGTTFIIETSSKSPWILNYSFDSFSNLKSKRAGSVPN